MKENCKGFSLIEVITSFGLILTFLFYFVPEWIALLEQRESLRMKSDMIDILHDETQSLLYDQGYPESGKVVRRNGNDYEFRWEEEMDSSYIIACVHHIDDKGKETNRCTNVKK